MTENVHKKGLWGYVNQKIKRQIHHRHTWSVICILFEEMIKDLRAGKEIKIANFGRIILKNMPARSYHHITLRQRIQTSGNRIIRFQLLNKIARKLCNSVILDKK